MTETMRKGTLRIVTAKTEDGIGIPYLMRRRTVRDKKPHVLMHSTNDYPPWKFMCDGKHTLFEGLTAVFTREGREPFEVPLRWLDLVDMVKRSSDLRGKFIDFSRRLEYLARTYHIEATPHSMYLVKNS